ncbi:MAG: CocE/NonD family hydrolase [bacterium]|nr:CocE/NonD family hydrolase [bacterium]
MKKVKNVIVLFIATVLSAAIFFQCNPCSRRITQEKEKTQKPSIAGILFETIESEGIENALLQYRELKEKRPDSFIFGKKELAELESKLYKAKKINACIAILKLNLQNNPRYGSGYEKLAYRYITKGKYKAAVINFKKAAKLGTHKEYNLRRAYNILNYEKKWEMVAMRDGIKLYTQVYSPRDKTQKYPIILTRDPYGINRHDNFYTIFLGPTQQYAREKFIFVMQDIRGQYMSEGTFRLMRPYIENKENNRQVDESSDTYDTVEWMIKNIPNNNGKVGIWGISYLGFTTAMGAIDAHPAVKAVSIQAPMADLFLGDDSHHNGAFYLSHAFDLFTYIGYPREKPYRRFPWHKLFEIPTKDGYAFFLEMGSLAKANKKYLKNTIPLWNKLMKHGTYDHYWKTRSTLPHFKKIKPAVLNVGGWFDAENLFGTLATYRSIEEKNPAAQNTLVMGPWYHGGWFEDKGDKLGKINFGSNTSEYLHKMIEYPFFKHYLKGSKDWELKLPEACVFETGSNHWRTYERWPPPEAKARKIYLKADGELTFREPCQTGTGATATYREYVSDPAKPVPFTAKAGKTKGEKFMVEDQRFVSQRPDVLAYKGLVLEKDITVLGPVTVDLYVSTTGTDSDWVVKLIDENPPKNTREKEKTEKRKKEMEGYQMLVRGDIMRGKFRNSMEHPEPFVPGEVTRVTFTLQDINHSFLKGHKIMIQVQSTWFPLFDRNPQKYVDVYNAKEADFQKARQRVYCTKKYPSHLEIKTIEKARGIENRNLEKKK